MIMYSTTGNKLWYALFSGAYKLKSLRAHVFVSQCLCNQQNYKPAFFWICGDESQAGLQQVES